jgi:hypothetical protein
VDESNDRDVPEMLISQAQPYRTPIATSDGPRRSSLIGWLTIAGILLGGAVAVGYARLSSEENASDHIRQFGEDSRAGLREVPWDQIDGASEGGLEPE